MEWNASDFSEALKRKATAVRDVSIRRIMIATEIAALDVEMLAEVLRLILERAASGSPGYKNIVHSLGDMSEFRNRAGRKKIDELVDYCVRKGHDELTVLFREIPPKKMADDHPEDVYIDHRLQDLALGLRKTMGRTGDRDLINRLLHDQDPAVVEQILENPGLTEEQVVRIAAKRPTSGEVLRKIGMSNKWGNRYRIRKALVFNPYTPTDMSIRFVRLLMRQDIQEVATNEALHFELRIAARRLIAEG